MAEYESTRRREICVLNTLDFDALQRFTKQARELQAIVADIQPFFNTLKELDGKTFIPTDRLIRTHEAAQILGVSKATIGEFVKAGLLTPFYVNSDQRKFWLSQVKSLPRTIPWIIKE